MDREFQDLQFLRLFGIYREGCKIIFSLKKIFSQITIAFIFPLTSMFLAEVFLSDVLLGKLTTGEPNLFEVLSGRPRENADRPLFWSFRVAYPIFLLIFALLSTSAVVYSVACIYTAKPMTFKKVMTVVPKVWKRLLVTFLWNLFIMVFYHGLLFLILLLWASTVLRLENKVPAVIVLVILIIFYLIGFVYINMIWELSCVVSVLEPVYGIKAMKKSKELVKGNLFAAVFIFVAMFFPLVVIERLFQSFVVHGDDHGMVYRVIVGVLSFLVVLIVILYGLVVETVIYLVCKSLHHETIDKSSLAEHLEGYSGEYVPLRGRGEVQLEQLNV